MPKKVIGVVKLHCPAGKANPAPPVGPALGQHGVNIMEFCKAFNEKTQQDMGDVIPVEITIYQDKSFSFITKTPPAASLLKQAAGIDTASGQPNREKVGVVTMDQVREIAERKMDDLNARDMDAACNIIAGTARSMGLVVGETAEEAERKLAEFEAEAKRREEMAKKLETEPEEPEEEEEGEEEGEVTEEGAGAAETAETISEQ